MTAIKTAQNERLKRNEEKWTVALMDAGWTVLPSIILEKQHALLLDATDVNILVHLARHWWYSDSPPHPSKGAIAECMDISESTVQKRIAQMEKSGFIKRIPRFNQKHGQETNAYTFDGLIKSVTPYAQESIAARDKRRDEDDARRKRKKASPTLVVNNKPGLK